MFNVCPQCGMYSVEKEIDPRGPRAICPHCGHAHPFLRLPLFLLSGASGTGKSTICLGLDAQLPECVCLESDILWRGEFATPEDDYRSYRDLWLRVAKNIAQAGRPVVLCGTALPEQFESCPERRYVGDIHALALVCDEQELVRRLQARPAWRQTGSDEFVQRMVAFDRWLREPRTGISVLDTTHLSIAEATGHVAAWVRARLPSSEAEDNSAGRQDPFGQADILRIEARDIISRLGLMEMLGQLGRVEVVGSVALGLVVKRDIDLHLLTATEDLLVVTDRLYHQLIDRDDVSQVRVSDYRAEGGIKIGIDAYRGPSGDWSIDLWLTNRLEATAFTETAHLVQSLTMEHRRAILDLKHYYYARSELRHGLSTIIYHAVLDGGVRTLAEFERYRAQRSGG